MSKFAEAVKEAKTITSKFDDMVTAEREKGGLTKEPAALKLPTAKSFIEYKINDDGYSQEEWPAVFRWTPQVGDMVESQSGVSLKINSITYKVGGVVVIALGRDLGGSSGMEGAGSNPNPFS